MRIDKNIVLGRGGIDWGLDGKKRAEAMMAGSRGWCLKWYPVECEIVCKFLGMGVVGGFFWTGVSRCSGFLAGMISWSRS